MTTRANSLMQDIHDRMPVILARENYSKWLDPVFRDPGVLLRPCSSKRMCVSAVSTHVNNPRNNDTRCIQLLEGQGIHG
jgi:putative SOS response-associated peptidase YedK